MHFMRFKHLASWLVVKIPTKLIKSFRQKLSDPLYFGVVLFIILLMICVSTVQPSLYQNLYESWLLGSPLILYIPEQFHLVQSPRDVQSGAIRDAVANKPAAYGSERSEHTLATKITSANGEPLKVVVLSHSHVDPGWLVTFEQYYTDKVVKIIDNIVKYLSKEPTMRMIWSEISFLQRWWEDASSENKATLKKLISSGRLEITGGGWVMTDEASPYYWATIDSLIEGHQFLFNQLDVLPQSAWSNDPFGHGATVPYLMRMSGVNATTIDRVDGKVKASLRENQQIIFNWRQAWDNTGSTDSLVHLLPYFYTTSESCGPYMYKCCAYDYGNSGFCPVKPITNANIDEAVEEIGKIYRKLATYSGLPVLLVILGNDFRFLQASEWEETIKNYKLIFDRLNQKYNFDINFGTLSDFFNAAHEMAEAKPSYISKLDSKSHPSLPVLSGDFFPNWDQKDVYWTSYFTTHMFGKRLDRVIQSELRSTDIMVALLTSQLPKLRKKIDEIIKPKLEMAHRNLGLFQHHDAITGTSRTNVMSDYYKRLDSAWRDMKFIQAIVQNTLILGTPLSPNTVTQSTFNSNMEKTKFDAILEPVKLNRGEFKDIIGKFGDIKRASTGRKSLVTVFNSEPLQRQMIVRVRLDSYFVEIFDLNTTSFLQFQVNPVIDAQGELMQDTFDVIFQILAEPLAIHVFEIQRRRDPSKRGQQAFVWTTQQEYYKDPRKSLAFDIEEMDADHYFVGSDRIKAKISNHTGFFNEIRTWDGSVYPLEAQLWTYNHAGGQYIMKASNPNQLKSRVKCIWKMEGNVVTDVHAVHEQHRITIVTTVVNADSPLQYSKISEALYMTLYPDMTGLSNTLLTLRLTTSQFDVPSKHQFYTDSNGFQLIRRRYLPDVSIDGNLFPTAASAIVEGEEHRLTVLTGQPHGVTRTNEGHLELLLDEVVSANDDKGLESGHHTKSLPSRQIFGFLLERLMSPNETADHTAAYSLSYKANQVLQNLLYPPVVSHSWLSLDESLPSKGFTPLLMSLPCQLQMVNMRPVGDGQFLLILRRLPNPHMIVQKDLHNTGCFIHQENETLENLQESLNITEIVETTLTGTRIIQKLSRLSEIASRIKPMHVGSYKIRIGSST